MIQILAEQIFFFSKALLQALGHMQSLLQWVLGVKQPKPEADHSLPSSSKVKHEWSYSSTPHMLS
jgi:hypothetical protein